MGRSERKTCSLLVVACLALWGPLYGAIAAESPLIDLDAAKLASGDLSQWPNQGALGGNFVSGGEKKPAVAEVAGRKAVVVDEGRYFRSTFAVPDEITGDHPFTVAVWACGSRGVGKEVLVAWAARPKQNAEFGVGRGGDAAFSGERVAMRYASAPAPKVWHHLVLTYGDGRLSLYVDGRLDSQRAQTLGTKVGSRIYLGAAWDAARQEPAFAFRGAFSRLLVWDRALSYREVRNMAGAFEPFEPLPADDAVIEALAANLRWQPGDANAATFRVLLGSDRAAIERGADPALVKCEASQHEACSGVLLPGTEYFWRVEQLDAAGKSLILGPIWRFTVDAGRAHDPFPRNCVAGVKCDVKTLAWQAGRFAVSHDVYFGDDAASVAASNTPVAKGLPLETVSFAMPLGALEPGKTYYWRVDENNGDLPAARGEVWAFRTEDLAQAGTLTFFVVADTHYGLDPRGDAALQILVDKMNWLPGASLPAKLGGGMVRTPCGVLHIGDMTNDGKELQLAAFQRDFGVCGEGRLAWPVYEAFGNHDGGPESPARKIIRERTKSRVGLAGVSENGLHYSWDWEGVHFVNLNISPGATARPYDPERSLAFLKEDLAEHCGEGGPIILMHHFGFDRAHSMSWWSDEARAAYLEQIQDRNVLGIFHGHAHAAEIYRNKDLDIFHPPHMQIPDPWSSEPCRHGFFVVQIANDEMFVAERKLDDTWGLTARKEVRRPKAISKSLEQ